jgi:3-phenylpropionate/trans-cinnamate dioxygenase ferredoxin reductase subunit
MPIRQETVIVGSGQAGFQLASSLRAAGFSGNIRLVGDEPPYQRPPLSKAFLGRELNRDDLLFASQDHYTGNEIDLVQGRVTEIDPRQGTITLNESSASAQKLPYDNLILATGARNRALPDADGAEGVLSLRTVAEAEQLRDRVSRGDRLIIIGGGFLGLEAAASLAAAGVDVHVLEMKPRVMSRAVSSPISAAFLNIHEAAGVRFTLGVSSIRLHRNGRHLEGVEADGVLLRANAVLSSIGVVPNVELASEAGLACQNGILTDAQLRTSASSVFAIGDCASYANPWLGGVVRLESVQNAVDQAKCVAAALTGDPQPYRALPWFWSEQAGVRLQIIGNTAPSENERIVHGNLSSNAFSVFHFYGESLVGAESINRPKDQMIVRKLLEAGRRIGRDELPELLGGPPTVLAPPVPNIAVDRRAESEGHSYSSEREPARPCC